MSSFRSATIGVIGLGPRGTSILERLGANLDELLPEGDIDLHLIDPHLPGAGRVWRRDQSLELVMNTLAGAVTNFPDASVTCAGPIVDGPTMYEWCVLLRAGDPEAASAATPEVADGVRATFAAAPPASEVLADADLVAEVRRTEPWSHPSRALYGHYLTWCFERALAMLPDRVRVVLHSELAASVTALPGVGGNVPRERITLAGGRELDCDAVIMALGWLDAAPSAADTQLAEAPDAASTTWVGPASPVEQDLDALPAGGDVIVRGLGMNFFDAMALLTLGRGGTFVRVSDDVDGLEYRPSGQEPRLLVSSRRGVPFRSKTLYGSLPPAPAQVHLREARFAERTDQIDFDSEIRPLILKDALRDYYLTLARATPDALVAPVDTLLEAIARHPADSAELATAVAHAIPDPADRLDLQALEVPVNRVFSSPEEYTEWVLDYIRHDLREGRLGTESPLKAAAWSISAARGAVAGYAGFGGLEGTSFTGGYKEFLAFGGMMGSGPPAFRLEQLLALCRAGIVSFLGPHVRVNRAPDGASFVAESPLVHDSRVVAPALLDAWMYSPTVQRTVDPLLAGLLRDGRARAFRVPNADGSHSTTEGVEIDRATSRLVDATGEPQASLYLAGIPTEDVRGFTVISPMPNTNSPMLRETDAIVRDVLASAAERTGSSIAPEAAHV
ncbi:FAD/NAD(P)-binding protein [Planctomonas psychrotolerans]|uniref:FAD/NAD(P)-binding protein n=1 Tax=Planctomonas psychrotolerans TaxID=2528712 RepID=UPI001D0D5284|nr:FAD/NAD(P)-binding protein [Planctomonas psychrotolerans]